MVVMQAMAVVTEVMTEAAAMRRKEHWMRICERGFRRAITGRKILRVPEVYKSRSQPFLSPTVAEW